MNVIENRTFDELKVGEAASLSRTLTYKDNMAAPRRRRTPIRTRKRFPHPAAAQHRGYAYIALTDHSRRVTVAHGLDAARLSRQIDEIDKLNAKLSGFSLNNSSVAPNGAAVPLPGQNAIVRAMSGASEECQLRGCHPD